MKPLLTVWAFLLLCSYAWTQNALSGTITNEEGEPMPFASVLITNTQEGAVTDADGFFRFVLPEAGLYRVRISYIGYKSVEQEVQVDGPTNVEIRLEETGFTLPDVELIGTWADPNTPITYTNLSREELEVNNLGQDVPFLVRWTPSAVVNSDAGTGIGYTDIRIRGSDATRINVTINGIPLNDAESQGVFWVNLPDFVSSTDMIQIQRGAGTSTNGAGAFGATINLKTTDRKAEPYVELNNSVGSFNTFKHNIQAGSGLIDGRFTFDGRLSRITSDGYIDRATARLHSFYASAGWWGETSSLQLNVFSGSEITYQAWNGVPAQYINDDELRTFNTAGTERPGEPHDNEVDDYNQTHYQLHYKKQFAGPFQLNAALHYTRGKGFFEQYKAGEMLNGLGFPDVPDTLASDLVRRRWLDNHYYGVTYNLRYQPIGNRLSMTLGGALNNYVGRHFGETIWTAFQGEVQDPPIYYDNDAEKLDFNVYFKTEYLLTPQLNIYGDLQYRRVDYEFLGFEDVGLQLQQSETLNFFNPKVGLFYDLQGKGGLYASFSVAQREPNRNDFTESSQVSRPRSETMYDTELGYRLEKKRVQLGANLYWMTYDDQLVPTGRLNDVGAATRINVDKSYRLGVELDGRIEVVDGVHFGGTLTLSRNKIDQFDEYIDNWDTGIQEVVRHENTDLALSPNVIASAEVSVNVLQRLADPKKQSLVVSLQGKHVGEQFIDNTSNENTMLDAYFFSDLGLRYQLQRKGIFKEVAATLMVRNVFDARFETRAWTYRFISEDNDPRADPYVRLEGGTTYNQTGFFPQAGRNFLLGLTLRF
ncbi:MAG: TonB-dependent receptor [Bacteroidota bacterium]